MRLTIPGYAVLALSTLFLFACGDDNDGEPEKPSVKADVSGMPKPPTNDVGEPDGEPGNLKILDWAGFKSAVTYTFDDSQPSQIEHYDALQATGIRMTFFAATGTPSNTANYDETWSQAVEDGHEIGNHTEHHCYADTLDGCNFGPPEDTTDAEIEECSTYITENFGQKAVWTMASPFGDGNWNEVAAKYFFLNRSVANGTISPNDDHDPFNLPSRMLKGGESVDTIAGYLDSVNEDGKWLIFCFHSILPTSEGNQWYASVEIDSITGSIDHVKSLETMWADTMANIGAYWMGQKILSEVTPTKDGDTTVWKWELPDHFPKGKYLRVTVDGGTLSQNDKNLTWSKHGYYEISLDAKSLTLTP